MTLSSKQLKKLPYNLILLLLTGGSSLILGVLSFSGMYALIPALPLALAAFGLSVAYEGEVYLQNIKGALNKLLANKYLQRQIARQFLLESFPDIKADNCPQFFKDYDIQLSLLKPYLGKKLTAKQRKDFKRIKKTLTSMERWFADQLFREQCSDADGKYALELFEWLEKNGKDNCLSKYQNHKTKYNIAKGLSFISSIFFGLGSTYLLVEAFTTIPTLAAISVSLWPVFIVPMAIIAGIGSGLMTYNTMTDMINNNTINKWYNKVKNDLKEGITFKSVFMASSAVLLSLLAVALTLCTAGTWWTVVKETRPLFSWMKQMPGFIMTVLNPIVTGLSAILFNIENTSETLELIDEALESDHKHDQKGFFKSISDSVSAFFARENLLQIINPFRLILKLTYMPLKVLLFLGHLISIAVTADRVPGVPQSLSALLGLISEGFEDAHYFLGHSHDHDDNPTSESLRQWRLEEAEGHSHDDDLPSRALKIIFSPLFILSTAWDYLASQLNAPSRKMTFKQAYNRQTGQTEDPKAHIPGDIEKPSENWQREHAIYEIETFKSEHLKGSYFDHSLNESKCLAFTNLQRELRNTDKAPAEILKSKPNDVLQKHGFFAFDQSSETDSSKFLRKLPERVSAPTAA